ncbi:MAG: hypothetical protein P9M03_05550, partial [Candidatus Theseobacter exili]|nr:hypothetical protein [Candidatus Theseobacter exili]
SLFLQCQYTLWLYNIAINAYLSSFLMILLWLQIFIKKIQFLLDFQSIKSDLLGYLGGRSAIIL